MRTLVTYMSLTGNTQKVAEAIYGEIEGEKELKSLNEVNSLEGYDLAFIGFPIHAFGPAQEGRDFLMKHAAGRKVAIFITHAAFEENDLTRSWVATCLESAKDAEVLGTFHCQGELAQEIAAMLINDANPQMQAFGHQREATIGQPDASRLEKARAFARSICASE